MQVRSLGWKDPWRRAWKPTPVFLPGAFHGQRSLEGYSSWCCKEWDATEATSHARMQGKLVHLKCTVQEKEHADGGRKLGQTGCLGQYGVSTTAWGQ